MAELQASDEDPSGVMLGDGPHLSRVRDRLSEAGLEDSVTLAGWVDDPDVYLDRASIYVSTSSRDALPLTLLEAMAAGLVPVAPRIGAIPEVVHHGQNGFLYPAGDTEGLVRVLEWIDSGVDVDAVGERARETASRDGYDAAAGDWERIVWLVSREFDATPATSLDSETS